MYECHIPSLFEFLIDFNTSWDLFFILTPLPLNIISSGLPSLPEALFVSGAGFSSHFANLLQPIQGETDLIGRHPEAEHSIRSVIKYQTALEELKGLISPELELIDSRIGGPSKELQSVMRLIRKSITKREHKVKFSGWSTFYVRLNTGLVD